MAVRGSLSVSCAQYFDSNSEYTRLLIQTQGSYKLNQTGLGTFTRQNGMMVEVIEVTKRFRIVENSDVVSSTTSDLLANVVDETLTQVFKKEGVRVIYDYFENNHHLKREEIAEKPGVFSNGLERLLGSAAPVIENLILKNLHAKIGLKFREKKGYGFSDYVKELRESAVVEG